MIIERNTDNVLLKTKAEINDHIVNNGLAVVGGKELVHIGQSGHFVSIDKQQAAQLIEVLTKWVNGGEVE